MSRSDTPPFLTVLSLAMISASSFSGAQAPRDAPPEVARANPLLTPSPLPFEAPPFDAIRDADFAPSFEAGMREQRAEVAKIADDPARPTFENTLVALERSGRTLTRVSLVFNALSSANTNDAIQKLQEEIAPKLAAHQDSIVLNAKLFGRIESLYKTRDRLRLDRESKRLLEYQYEQFVMAGARLSEADKERLKTLNAEDAALSAKFTNQLLAAAKAGALIVSDNAPLAGLAPPEIDAAAEAAKARHLDGKWLIPLSNTTQQPALASLVNRGTREQLFRASSLRAERADANDTRAVIARLAQIRAEKAGVLGLPNFAAWRLQDQMARTPERVRGFLDALVPAATRKAQAEATEIAALIERQGARSALEPWDWNFYAEQVRKASFDLDAGEVKPYFELNRVLQDGVFFAAHELYGISFNERHDLPVYHSDVRVFEVFDRTNRHLGLIYFDYFKRDNKNGGAWMDTLVPQSQLLGTAPVIYNVANFAKPAPGQPALVSFDDVTTMFHEFGHALHGLFANQRYPTLSGTAVARDFVEFPSQLNEHWALDPKVLAHYARHYQNGAAMPAALVDKIKRAAKFNQGYAVTELLEAALLDMAWHTLQAPAGPLDVDQFEQTALARAGVDLPQVPPRYRSSYFLHIWANGYAAAYYAYLWTEMLDDDAFAWFVEHGGLTLANGQRFRDAILSKGNTEEYAKMFRDFRGRDPSIDPMLVHRGLQ
jgi:peptidyl-dipeptidase Dcp